MGTLQVRVGSWQAVREAEMARAQHLRVDDEMSWDWDRFGRMPYWTGRAGLNWEMDLTFICQLSFLCFYEMISHFVSFSSAFYFKNLNRDKIKKTIRSRPKTWSRAQFTRSFEFLNFRFKNEENTKIEEGNRAEKGVRLELDTWTGRQIKKQYLDRWRINGIV